MGFWRVDRVWFGEHLQSGGEVRSLADDRLLLRGALADQIADHYQAGSDPDARMELVGFDGRKCVSVGNRRLSQVKVDPHLAQNPRRVLPGVESNLAISPLVTVYAARSNATKTETGAPLCFRQLWQ